MPCAFQDQLTALYQLWKSSGVINVTLHDVRIGRGGNLVLCPDHPLSHLPHIQEVHVCIYDLLPFG